MLINPFKLDINMQNNTNTESIDIESIIKYLSTNYAKYLKNADKDFFVDKIKEYIYLKYKVNNEKDIDSVISKVLDKIFGYGILQKYIDDEFTTDIRVVRFDLIYIKQKGKWQKIDEKFESREALRDYINYCAIKNDKTINYDEPLLIASDKEYKLRIEAGISPVNSFDDNLVIRIHKNNNDINLYNLYKKYKMIDKEAFKRLKEIIESKLNVVICGKGGSGKTTLLKALLKEFDENISITVSEETSELYIDNKNIIQREITLDRLDNKISLEELLKHSLVMSSDVLVVGELKGEETYVFFDAINTGHMGITTVHANSVTSAIDRLVLLFKRNIKAEKYSEDFVKEILYKNIDYIIYMQDFKLESIGKVYISNSVNTIQTIYTRGKDYE